MTDHGMDAPVLGILLGVEDRPIKRLPDAEHAAFTGTNDWPIANREGLCAFIASPHQCSLIAELLPQSEPPQPVDRG